MKKLPQISEAEFEVMRVISEHAPISTNEVTERLTKTTQWSPKTIQTMLKRLVTKGAISYEKESRVFIYSPLVQEDEYINQESKSFLKRYYHGDFTSMLSAFLDNHSLSEEEIALSSFAYPSALHKASETPIPAMPSDKYPKSIPE